MKTKTLKVYIESGDKYKFKILAKTDQDQLELFLRQQLPDEWETNEDGENDGPGFRGSYLYIDED